jgi:alpha-galactosidase
MRSLIFLVCLISIAVALDNGLGRVPPMGYSSWNDASSAISEERIKNITAGLLRTGLAAKGYIYVNVDEGWLKGRYPNGTIYEDLTKFPSTMKGLGDWIHSQQVPGSNPPRYLRYGLYTSRGTCQCGTSEYSAPGTQGYEQQDAQFMVDAGMDYFKEDSCCGSQDHDTAFADYSKMRDILNATGRPVYFSLCGWNSWYAPVGKNLGNSWRIAGDGQNWPALVNCINVNAQLGMYAGPGGWNDPDLLIGTGVGSYGPDRNNWYQTDLQSRSQFSMWCVMAAPLLISADINSVSDYALQTWGNDEAIAVNQDPLGIQGVRLVGADLGGSNGTNIWGRPLADGSWAVVFLNNNPSDQDMTCDDYCFSLMTFNGVQLGAQAVAAYSSVVPKNCTGATNQKWTFNANGTIGSQSLPGWCLAAWSCGTADNTDVRLVPCGDLSPSNCNYKDQSWTLDSSARLLNAASGKCFDQYEYTTARVDIYTCNGGGNQAWTHSAANELIAKQSQQCLTALPQFTEQTVNVRDLWAHANLTATTTFKGFTSTKVPGQGGCTMYKFSVPK